MPLLDFYKTNKEMVLTLLIEQVLSNAGDGVLRDESKCSEELREYFKVVPVEKLVAYARRCLETPFTSSGLVLQDVVNEIGRRLEFDVDCGLYRGKTTAVGFDGIWRSSGAERDLIVEVKTTDAYNFSLDRLASYRDRLEAGNLIRKGASFLIVVGRAETGTLEDQVRGSRYAWDMRIIGIEYLIKLVQIMEKSDDSSVVDLPRRN